MVKNYLVLVKIIPLRRRKNISKFCKSSSQDLPRKSQKLPPAICSILRFLLGFALVLLDDSAVLDFASELLHTASPSEFCHRQVRYLAPPAPKSFHFTFSSLRLENLPPAWKFASGETLSISPQFCTPVITKSLQPLVGDAATCRDYGRSVGNTKLAEIVVSCTIRQRLPQPTNHIPLDNVTRHDFNNPTRIPPFPS